MRPALSPLVALLAGACVTARAPEAATREPAHRVVSDTALVVVADSLVPEAVAHHDGALLLGSIARQRVYRAAMSPGPVSRAVPWSPPLGGAVLGLKVDTLRGVLWAAVTPPAGHGSGALVALQLGDGTVARTVPLPSGGAHLPNDLALAADGTIYLTDTAGGVVWSLAPGAPALAVALPRVDGWSQPNGVALSPDGTRLYVAYAEGIVVAPRSATRTGPLRALGGFPLPGLDGLYVVDGSLVGIQNGGAVAQVVRASLARDGWSTGAPTVVERGHPAHEAPTTGVPIDGRLVYVANSQLNRWKAKRAIGDTTVILRLPRHR